MLFRSLACSLLSPLPSLSLPLSFSLRWQSESLGKTSRNRSEWRLQLALVQPRLDKNLPSLINFFQPDASLHDPQISHRSPPVPRQPPDFFSDFLAAPKMTIFIVESDAEGKRVTAPLAFLCLLSSPSLLTSFSVEPRETAHTAQHSTGACLGAWWRWIRGEGG